MIRQRKKDKEMVPYEIIASDGGDAWVEAAGEKIFAIANLSFYFAENERNGRRLSR